MGPWKLRTQKMVSHLKLLVKKLKPYIEYQPRKVDTKINLSEPQNLDQVFNEYFNFSLLFYGLNCLTILNDTHCDGFYISVFNNCVFFIIIHHEYLNKEDSVHTS